MSKLFLGFLCITCLCSCGFFERKPLSEEQIRSYIFDEDAVNDPEINFFSRGGVGGYGFVVRLEVNSSDGIFDQLDGFELTSHYTGDDPNRFLIIDMFTSSVAQFFSNSNMPKWIPQETTCEKGVSLYEKEESGLTVYAYQGVGQCNELFLFGFLD